MLHKFATTVRQNLCSSAAITRRQGRCLSAPYEEYSGHGEKTALEIEPKVCVPRNGSFVILLMKKVSSDPKLALIPEGWDFFRAHATLGSHLDSGRMFFLEN